MTDKTPYEAPESDVSQIDMEFEPVRFFSTTQRIGRLRWFAYNLFFSIVAMFFSGMIAAITLPAMTDATGSSPMTPFVMLLFYIPPVVVGFILARRRLHDLERSGWFSLLLFVPLVNLFMSLYLLFAPGTQGENRYGLRPEPNTFLIWIVGLFVLIAFIGILAAIAIPAYNGYIEAARSAAEQVQ